MYTGMCISDHDRLLLFLYSFPFLYLFCYFCKKLNDILFKSVKNNIEINQTTTASTYRL